MQCNANESLQYMNANARIQQSTAHEYKALHMNTHKTEQRIANACNALQMYTFSSARTATKFGSVGIFKSAHNSEPTFFV